MENNLTKEEFRKTKQQLIDELDSLTNNCPDYKSLNRIDEILDLLTDIEGFPEYDVDQSWKAFKTTYIDSIKKIDLIENDKPKRKSYKKAAIFLVAAIVVINLFTTIFAGSNIFTFIYSFNKNAVVVKTDNEINPSENYDDIQFNSITEMEKYVGLDIIEIGYIPNGYNVSRISCDKDKTFMLIVYTKGEGEIINYIIQNSDVCPDVYFESNEGEQPVISYNNIEYHLIKNVDYTLIQWQSDNLIYCISGNLTDNETKKIIKNLK